MAIVTNLREATRLKPVPRPAGLPLPQACRSAPAVRGLLRTGEVIRLSKAWTDPAKIARAEEKLRETEDKLLIKLPVSVWYGAFHLRGKVRQDGRLAFAVACVCGGEYILTTEQLVTALLEHTGCRRECCQQRTLLRLFWGTLAESLAVQWRILQVCHPGRMFSYWGGTMDTVYERDLDYGFVRAYQEMLQHKVDLSRPDFRWITPLNPELPYTQDNIELTLFPWSGIARLNRLAPVIGGQPIPIAELCKTLDVTVEQVLETVVDEGVNPDELVMALLQKGVPK